MQAGVSLLRVLLVDDEPFIRKGLAALIDWEAEGYYIAGEASDGKAAVSLLRHNDYDLIISDIKMPEMDGIEFITYVRDNSLSRAKFVFLSGFYDFQYAKKAILYGCCDYVLKPIQKEELLSTLRRTMDEFRKEAGGENRKKDYEKAYLDRNLLAVIWGKYDSINLSYVQDKIMLSNEIAYVHCEISLNDERFLALPEDDRREQQRRLYDYANLLLKNYSDHIISDILKHTRCYDIGIIYCARMSAERGISKEEWLDWLIKELSERVGFEIAACMGSRVNSISRVMESFREAVMIRSLRFYKKHEKGIIGIYKKEHDAKEDILKKQLESLVHVMEINDVNRIKENAKAFYGCMMDKNINPEAVSRNIQYLIYRLLGLAYDQDADINQEEIMQYIRDSVFSSNSDKENGQKFQQFTLVYSDYLAQLRHSTSKGTINLIENEIEENYSENLSLKSLGEKYCINSAYLGQLFKKQYGCAFKDHLNNVRIRKAAEMMLRTDKKVYEIAGDAGYKNLEYFISKFEEAYGVTPTRFRKRYQLNQKVYKNI